MLMYRMYAKGWAIKPKWIIAVAFAIGLLTGCSEEPESRARAIATVGMVADLARNVAGDRFDVQSLLGPGTDPHLYTPTRNDVVALNSADIVFYNGLLLEGKMSDVLVRMANAGRPVYPVAELAVKRGDYTAMDAEEGHFDPHVWMDVQGWITALDVIVDALATFDEDHRDVFTANADRYRKQLLDLDAYARQAIASIPESQRVLVTAHDAFGYMGRAYGLEVRGIQGISTESEAGMRDVESLISFIVERQIPAIFVESSVSDRHIRAVVEGAAARGHRVAIGGELFSDAMGLAGTYSGTYIGMIDHNITTIARALGGHVPEGGLNGKLGIE